MPKYDLLLKIGSTPSYIGWKKLNRQSPDFLFTDLDLCRFKSSKEALDIGLNKTCYTIVE